MIEDSDVLLVAAVLALAAVVASYKPWRRLRCGHPFGVNPTSGRIDRCQQRAFHRGRHVRPWSARQPIGYLHSVPERCGQGHVHADLGDAIACMYGADADELQR